LLCEGDLNFGAERIVEFSGGVFVFLRQKWASDVRERSTVTNLVEDTQK